MEIGRAIIAQAPAGLFAAMLAIVPASAAPPVASQACGPPASVAGEAPAIAANVRTAVIDNCLTVSGPELTAHQIDTRMSVGVEVNGSGPFRFLVDSGADRSVIGAALARHLNLPASETVRLNDITGAIDVSTYLVDMRSPTGAS